MKIYNNNQIVSIELFDEEPIEDYFYLEEMVGFFGFKRQVEPGIYTYREFDNSWIKGEKLRLVDKVPTNMFKKGNTLYSKVRVEINYSNKTKETIFFDTLGQAKSFIAREFPQNNNWRRSNE